VSVKGAPHSRAQPRSFPRPVNSICVTPRCSSSPVGGIDGRSVCLRRSELGRVSLWNLEIQPQRSVRLCMDSLRERPGPEPSTPSLPSSPGPLLRVAEGCETACLSGGRGGSPCDRLPPVAPALLHKRSTNHVLVSGAVPRRNAIARSSCGALAGLGWRRDAPPTVSRHAYLGTSRWNEISSPSSTSSP
jgi:hypothetical protein